MRYLSLLRSVKNFNWRAWAARILPGIVTASTQSLEVQRIPQLNSSYFSKLFSRTNKRLLLLDFRGTLLPFQPIPQLNRPSDELVATLTELALDERNDVFVIAGVGSDILLQGLGEIDRLGFVSEYGYFIRYPMSKHFQAVRGDISFWWKHEVVSVLEYFSDHTPGSFLDIGESCVTWHFRDTDADYGLSQARLIHRQLEQMLQYQPAQAVLVFEKQYIVVHPISIHKGSAIRHIMREAKKSDTIYDLVFAMGDDKTDEAMFKELSALKINNLWSCSVNQRATHAQYYLDDVSGALAVLQNLLQEVQGPSFKGK